MLVAVWLSGCTGAADGPDPIDHQSAYDRYGVGDGGVSSFYRYDLSLPAESGVLLRQALLPAHQSLPGAAVNIRLLYTSTDGIGDTGKNIVSGSLFLPPGDAPEGGWPIILWSHGTVGVADTCAPSWTGYVPFHRAHLQQWLKQGYAIVASDYQGLGTPGTHPYLATRPAAMSNLDIIRAVQSADFPLSDRVVVAGQSQGAGAAIATAGFAETYAPEIELRAVVTTGVPYFSPAALTALRRARPRDVVDPKLGYSFLVLTLLELADPTFDAAAHVRPERLSLVRSVAEICNRDMRRKIAELALTYNDVFEDSAAAQIAKAYRHMGFPTLALTVPLFVGTGLADVDTPPQMQARLVEAACAAGTQVAAHRYPDHDHLSVLNHSLKDSVPFVAAAFSDATILGNCD